MPIPALAWAILPSVVSTATSIANRPKKRDYVPNTSYIDKYIANLQGRRAGREVERMAMNPALRAVGQQYGRGIRQSNYDAAKYGLTGSGIDIQQKLSLSEQATGALTQASEQAGMMQYRENRNIEDYIQQLMMQKGQMQEEGTRAFRQARRQSNADILGSLAQMGATIGAGVSQNIQNKNAVDMYGKLIQARGQTFTPEDTNTFINDISQATKEGRVDPSSAMKLMGEVADSQKERIGVSQGVNMITEMGKFYDQTGKNENLQGNISNITNMLKSGQVDFQGAWKLTQEAINVSEQTSLIDTNKQSLLKAGYSEQEIGDMPRSMIGNKTAVNKMIGEKELINTNTQLANLAGVEITDESILSNQKLFDAHMKKNMSGMNTIQKAAIAATTQEQLDAIITDNPDISMDDFNFVSGIKQKLGKTEQATTLAQANAGTLVGTLKSRFGKDNSQVKELDVIANDQALLQEAIINTKSRLYTILNELKKTAILDGSDIDMSGLSESLQQFRMILQSETSSKPEKQEAWFKLQLGMFEKLNKMYLSAGQNDESVGDYYE